KYYARKRNRPDDETSAPSARSFPAASRADGVYRVLNNPVLFKRLLVNLQSLLALFSNQVRNHRNQPHLFKRGKPMEYPALAFIRSHRFQRFVRLSKLLIIHLARGGRFVCVHFCST